MFAQLTAAALVVGLGVRPAALAGPDPHAYAAWLLARAQVADRAFGSPPCAAVSAVSLGGSRERPTEVAGHPAGRAVRGPVFLEHVRLSGCARTITHNLQVVRVGSGWQAIAVLPGASLASPRAQTDAMQRVAATAINGTPRLPCTASEALRTSTNGEVVVLTRPDPAGVWRERWPMRMCGQDRTVEVAFGPAVGGGSSLISVQPAWP